MRTFNARDFFWCSSRHHFTARVASFRTQIDDPICALDHFEVVLDHNDGMSTIDEPLK